MKNSLIAFFVFIGFSSAFASDSESFCYQGDELVPCDQVIEQDQQPQSPQSLTYED